ARRSCEVRGTPRAPSILRSARHTASAVDPAKTARDRGGRAAPTTSRSTSHHRLTEAPRRGRAGHRAGTVGRARGAASPLGIASRYAMRCWLSILNYYYNRVDRDREGVIVRPPVQDVAVDRAPVPELAAATHAPGQPVGGAAARPAGATASRTVPPRV